MEEIKVKKPFDWKKWAILVTLSLALAIIIIDGTVLNVSTANIIRDLNTDLKSIQWAITLYSLIIAALTITGGRLGDLFGRKRMFILGAVIFAIGSFITSVSPSIGILILGWSVIEGIGAALMLPATSALLVSTFHGRERGIAFGVWGGIAGAAAAFGPIVGGYLTTNYTWNWAFRINIVVAAVLILGSFLIKESRDQTHKPQLDIIGVILSSLGLASVVYGIIESSTYGWIKAKIPYVFAGNNYDLLGISITIYAVIFGLIILTAFLIWENAQEKAGNQPLLSLNLFRNRQFTSGIITTAALGLAQTGLVFAIPIFYQTVRGKDAFHTGLSLLPLSLSLLISAPLAGFLSSKFKPRTLIQIGIVLNFLGTIALYLALSVNADIKELALGQILFGAGFGMISAQITNLTLSAVTPKEIGEASGVNSMIRQLGSSLGSAIIGAVFLSTFISSFIVGVNQSTVLPDLLKSNLIIKVNEDSSSFQYGTAKNNQIPANIAADIKASADQGTVDGAKQSLVYVGGFVILTLLISFSLPDIKTAGKKQPGEPAVKGTH